MRRIAYLLTVIAIAFVACSCDSDAWDEMPDRAQSFVSQYFPGVQASATSVDADGQYTVKLRNSATIVFTELGVWLSGDGNGTPLPSNLLFNELPQAFYRYLDEMEAVTDGVYMLRRDETHYFAGLLDTTVGYDIASGRVYYPDSDQSAR